MKKIIIIILVSIVTFPSFTYAAWWNPSTWGKQRESVQLQAPAIKDSSIKKVDTEDDVRKKPHPSRPLETPPITSTDQTKIAALESENALLRKQLAGMKDSFNGCIRELSMYKTTPTTSSTIQPIKPVAPISKIQPITQ